MIGEKYFSMTDIKTVMFLDSIIARNSQLCELSITFAVISFLYMLCNLTNIFS